MQKLDLADHIIRSLCPDDDYKRAIDNMKGAKELTDELNDRVGAGRLTLEQVEAALSYLSFRDLIQAFRTRPYGAVGDPDNNLVYDYYLTTKGEDLVVSGYGVRDLARRNMDSYINNTTIQGDVEQFVQGDHNNVVQNKAATADDLLEGILRLLEDHNEVAAVKEAKEAKQKGGIRAALKYLADKAFGIGFSYAGTAVTQRVIATLPQITQALS